MSNPDPFRAFQGLSVAQAKLLGEKMGFRIIISKYGTDISSIPDLHTTEPQAGELGLCLSLNGKVSYVMVGRQAAALPSPKGPFDPISSPSRTQPSTPFAPAPYLGRTGTSTPFATITSPRPPPPFTPSAPPPTIPRDAMYPGAYWLQPNRPLGFYYSPPAPPGFYTAGTRKTGPFAVCTYCKKDISYYVKNGWSYAHCSDCSGYFCDACSVKHTTCKGKTIKAPPVCGG